MAQTLPETGPESRGGDHPDWDKAVAGEPLPEKTGETGILEVIERGAQDPDAALRRVQLQVPDDEGGQ